MKLRIFTLPYMEAVEMDVLWTSQTDLGSFIKFGLTMTSCALVANPIREYILHDEYGREVKGQEITGYFGSGPSEPGHM